MPDTNYRVGHRAEEIAAEYLKQSRYEVLALNWKNRYCEIDIVARYGSTMYFVEVKSRKNAYQGSGLDYITSRKLRQMHFAAQIWISQYDFNGDYELAAIAVDSTAQEVIEFLPSITT